MTNGFSRFSENSRAEFSGKPFNTVATIIFFAAIVHTFLAARFRKIAHRYRQSYKAIEDLLHATKDSLDLGNGHDKLAHLSQFLPDFVISNFFAH